MTDKLIEAMKREWRACMGDRVAPDLILCDMLFLRKLLRTVIRRRGKTFVIYPGLSDAKTCGRMVQAPMPPAVFWEGRNPYWRNAGSSKP